MPDAATGKELVYTQDFNPGLGLARSDRDLRGAAPTDALRAAGRPQDDALQVTPANDAGLSPSLLAAANSSGGVLGKMIWPQNLAIGAAAVGMAGQEGDLFRKVFVWSIVLMLLMCGIVYLQSTAVLDWMVVK